MAVSLGIFGSPITEIELFDLQNGIYTINILEGANYSSEPVEIEISDGNKIKKGHLSKLEFTILATNSEIIDELKKRSSIKQTILAKSLDSKVTLDDVFIKMAPERDFSGKAHIIKVTAQIIQED